MWNVEFVGDLECRSIRSGDGWFDSGSRNKRIHQPNFFTSFARYIIIKEHCGGDREEAELIGINVDYWYSRQDSLISNSMDIWGALCKLLHYTILRRTLFHIIYIFFIFYFYCLSSTISFGWRGIPKPIELCLVGFISDCKELCITNLLSPFFWNTNKLLSTYNALLLFLFFFS